MTPAHGTVTITAQSELQYAPVIALLLSIYLIFEAEALSHSSCIRLAWAPLGPIVSTFCFGDFVSRLSGSVRDGGGGSTTTRANVGDVGSAMLFGVLLVIGVWTMELFAPPSFPPPLFPRPLGLSVRAYSSNCAILAVHCTALHSLPRLAASIAADTVCVASADSARVSIDIDNDINIAVADAWKFDVRCPSCQYDGVRSGPWASAVGRSHCSCAWDSRALNPCSRASHHCNLCCRCWGDGQPLELHYARVDLGSWYDVEFHKASCNRMPPPLSSTTTTPRRWQWQLQPCRGCS